MIWIEKSVRFLFGSKKIITTHSIAFPVRIVESIFVSRPNSENANSTRIISPHCWYSEVIWNDFRVNLQTILLCTVDRYLFVWWNKTFVGTTSSSHLLSVFCVRLERWTPFIGAHHNPIGHWVWRVTRFAFIPSMVFFITTTTATATLPLITCCLGSHFRGRGEYGGDGC